MPKNKDMVAGQAKQVECKAKELIGKVTGDKSREIGGKAEQVTGKLQEDYGKAKHNIHKATK